LIVNENTIFTLRVANPQATYRPDGCRLPEGRIVMTP
jgi:hypothetical protein